MKNYYCTALRSIESGIEGIITISENLKGTFEWNGKKIKLNGKTEVSL